MADESTHKAATECLAQIREQPGLLADLTDEEVMRHAWSCSSDVEAERGTQTGLSR